MKTVKLMIATVMMAQIATTAHADFARVKSTKKNEVESKIQKVNVNNIKEFVAYLKTLPKLNKDYRMAKLCYLDKPQKNFKKDLDSIKSCFLIFGSDNKKVFDYINEGMNLNVFNEEQSHNSENQKLSHEEKMKIMRDATNAAISNRIMKEKETQKYQAAPAAAKVSSSAR